MSYLYQILVNGLHNGALYALLAYGYVLLHQVVPKPNLAHGAVFAFTGQVLTLGLNFAYNGLIFTFAASLAVALGISIGFGAIVVALFAITIVPRFVARSANMMIVCTLAISIVLMEAVRIGAEGRDMWLPALWATRVDLRMGAAVNVIQVVNMIVILLMIVGTDTVLRHTGFGRAIRAVSEDAKAASLCGVHVRQVIVKTAGLASILSAIGGLLAIAYFGNMSFGAGLTYGLKVLFIAAAGGFSTPRAAAIAAFGYGEAEALWDGYLPIMWREVFFLAVLALLLVVRGRENTQA